MFEARAGLRYRRQGRLQAIRPLRRRTHAGRTAQRHPDRAGSAECWRAANLVGDQSASFLVAAELYERERSCRPPGEHSWVLSAARGVLELTTEQLLDRGRMV